MISPCFRYGGVTHELLSSYPVEKDSIADFPETADAESKVNADPRKCLRFMIVV
jgi:hypothetical protein